MAEVFKPGDRVVIRNGEFGTIIRIDGGLAHLQLDSSVRKTFATAALTKVEGDEDPPGSSGSATPS
jgi:preprotein translocase subunit YajC